MASPGPPKHHTPRLLRRSDMTFPPSKGLPRRGPGGCWVGCKRAAPLDTPPSSAGRRPGSRFSRRVRGLLPHRCLFMCRARWSDLEKHLRSESAPEGQARPGWGGPPPARPAGPSGRTGPALHPLAPGTGEGARRQPELRSLGPRLAAPSSRSNTAEGRARRSRNEVPPASRHGTQSSPRGATDAPGSTPPWGHLSRAPRGDHVPVTVRAFKGLGTSVLSEVSG